MQLSPEAEPESRSESQTLTRMKLFPSPNLLIGTLGRARSVILAQHFKKTTAGVLFRNGNFNIIQDWFQHCWEVAFLAPAI